MPSAAHKKEHIRSRRLAVIAGITFVLAAVAFQLVTVPALQNAEWRVRDRLVTAGKQRPFADRFVFVGVDEASLTLDAVWQEEIDASPELKAISRSPSLLTQWPRSVFAGAIDRILSHGASLVVVDLLFTSPREGDEVLRSVVDKYAKRVVLASAFSGSAHGPDRRASSVTITFPTPTLIQDPARDPRVGYANFWSQSDDVVRSAIYQTTLAELHDVPVPPGATRYRSMAAAALTLLGQADKIPDAPGPIYFEPGDYNSIPTIPFYGLFVPAFWLQNLKDGAIFRDKIVMIGAAAERLQDYHLTASGKMLGALLHIQALAAALDGRYLTLAEPWMNALLTLAAAAIGYVVVWRLKSPLGTFALLLAATASCGLVALVLIKAAHFLPAVVEPALALLASGLACMAWDFARERRETHRLRGTLERYVSRNVVHEILDNRDDFLAALEGTRRPMTILFSDVRGFTTFSEQADPAKLVDQLNEYLGEMVHIIFQHDGTVDKFIGDGIMAVWGNVFSRGEADDAVRATRAALGMRHALTELNARWAERGLPPFAIGIGINHGIALFGDIGSQEKMEPTVIGDAVNLASRVEGLTKQYGIDICLSESVADHLGDDFILRSVDRVQVVGRSVHVDIYTVLGERSEPAPAWLERYEQGVQEFRARDFTAAMASFQTCVEAAPDDKLCRIYLERARVFLANPPPATWTGTQIAQQK